MTDLNITFLGTSAAVPSPKRGLSGLAVQRGGDYLLFDCGEGTQRQMMRFTGLKAPKAIFITHAHGDHWLGLPGLIASLDMRDYPPDEIVLYAPDSMLTQLRVVLERSVGVPKWLTVESMAHGEGVRFDGYTVQAFPTIHSRGSQGYVLTEPERPGRFEPQIALLSGIEPGPDFKRLQNGETVKGLKPEDVIGPARPGRSLAYTGDTAYSVDVAKAVQYVDLLVHEATFEEDMGDRATATRHSTGLQAGQIARAADVGRLVLTHFSARSNPSNVIKSAACAFSPTVGATDGMTINLPFVD